MMKGKMRRSLKIGSRGSRLALWQAEFIKRKIQAKFPDIKIEISIIRTTGDKLSDAALSKIGGKGVFVKEIEEALLRGEIDMAVHSMKDLPTVLPRGLKIGAVTEREDPRDALLSREGIKFYDLSKGARLGTGSLRRQAQLLGLRPDIEVLPIRGNVDTRVRKLKNSGLDGVVLAVSGLKRMGLENEITEIFSLESLVPSPGQGIIAVESREGDEWLEEIVAEINHEETEIVALAERAFLERLSGSCRVPVGCYAEVIADRIRIAGLIAFPDGIGMIRLESEGSSENPVSLGKDLAERVLESGGKRILSSLVT
jgi:hydroxymethylbilane synthase